MHPNHHLRITAVLNSPRFETGNIGSFLEMNCSRLEISLSLLEFLPSRSSVHHSRHSISRPRWGIRDTRFNRNGSRFVLTGSSLERNRSHSDVRHSRLDLPVTFLGVFKRGCTVNPSALFVILALRAIMHDDV